MGSLGAVLVIGLMLATSAVLVLGLGLMARGGEVNRKYSNRVMAARIGLQAAAIGILALLLLTR